MKVIVAVDTSAYACCVIDAMRTRNWPADCTFYIITVAEETTGWFAAQPGRIDASFSREALEVFAHDMAMRLKNRLPNHAVFSDVLDGAPSEQIVDAARRLDADLIVVGQQGTAGVGGVFLGGIAEAVVHKAPCSVEVVKPKVTVQHDSERAGRARQSTALI